LRLALPANVSIKSTMAIPVIEEKDFEREVLRNEQPVLVDFYADWCAPCKTMEPEVVALAHELNGKAKVVKVNIDRSKVLAQRLRIQSVPTTMVFAGGRIAAAEVGALRRDQLRQMIEPFLPRAEGALRVAEVAQLLAQRQVALVDTRDPPVYARMHLPGAVNIPMAEIGSRLAELHMLPAEPVLYCRGGDQCKELAARPPLGGHPRRVLGRRRAGLGGGGAPRRAPRLKPRRGESHLD
jgi:thioredoxin 1/putative thioredoxin